MSQRYLALALLLAFFSVTANVAESNQKKALIIDVIDVGAGLCMVLQSPSLDGNKVMVYDVGSSSCGKSIKEIIGGNEIDLVVISHSDSDHYRGLYKALTPAIKGGYGLKTKAILDTGIMRFTKGGSIRPTYADYLKAKKKIPVTYSLSNPQVTSDFKVGKQWAFGDATVTFIHGIGEVEGQSKNKDPSSHDRNGASIVLRVEYGKNSILLTGDAVGVKNGDINGEQCVRTESRIVNFCDSTKKPCGNMNVDVMIAPHHGSHESLCRDFIELTDPEYVIFSAGRSHSHPRQVTYDRLIAYDKNIITFRTDKGESKEKPTLTTVGWYDQVGEGKVGDDNIKITMDGTGPLGVTILQP